MARASHVNFVSLTQSQQQLNIYKHENLTLSWRQCCEHKVEHEGMLFLLNRVCVYGRTHTGETVTLPTKKIYTLYSHKLLADFTETRMSSQAIISLNQSDTPSPMRALLLHDKVIQGVCKCFWAKSPYQSTQRTHTLCMSQSNHTSSLVKHLVALVWIMYKTSREIKFQLRVSGLNAKVEYVSHITAIAMQLLL